MWPRQRAYFGLADVCNYYPRWIESIARPHAGCHIQSALQILRHHCRLARQLIDADNHKVAHQSTIFLCFDEQQRI